MRIQSGVRSENSTYSSRFVPRGDLKGRPGTTTHPANRLEIVWAWASLLVLIICWDAALRLDQRVPVPRVRIAHAAEPERPAQTKELAEL